MIDMNIIWGIFNKRKDIMHKRITVIQCNDDKWIARKRGLFGWLYCNETYDDDQRRSYYEWKYGLPDGSYKSKSSHTFQNDDRFRSRRHCLSELDNYYHQHRKKDKKDLKQKWLVSPKESNQNEKK